jgi:RNA polymerase sigma-70 factor (ECF subfamily)
MEDAMQTATLSNEEELGQTEDMDGCQAHAPANELKFPGWEIDIEQLYRRYSPMVLRRCRSMLGHSDEAEDAAQEVFLKVIRAHDRLHGRYPSSLLYRIATNTCLNMLRSSRRRRAVADSELLEGIAARDELEERVLDRALASRLLSGESASTMRIVQLHYGEDRSLQETAAEVGLSVSGVRKRLDGVRRRSTTKLCA